MTNRLNKEEDIKSKTLNRFKNPNKLEKFVDQRFATNIEFNDFTPTVKPPATPSSFLKNKVYQLKETVVEEKTLKPSKSQLLRITHLQGSNPATLFNSEQIEKYQKKNQVAYVKQVTSSSIHNSKGMKNALKGDDKNSKFLEKITNYPAAGLKSCEGMTEKKKTLKTFRHIFDRNHKAGSLLY